MDPWRTKPLQIADLSWQVQDVLFDFLMYWFDGAVEIVLPVNPLLHLSSNVNFVNVFKNRLKLVGLVKNKHLNMVPKSVKVNDLKRYNDSIILLLASF